MRNSTYYTKKVSLVQACRELAILEDMKTKAGAAFRAIATKKTLMNYIGGLGYYALVFGWAVLALLMVAAVSQFVIAEGQSFDTWRGATSQPAVNEAGGGSPWLLVVAAPLITALIACVVALPYFVGKVASRFTRWCIYTAMVKETPAVLLKVKLGLALLLGVVTIVGVFGFYQSFSTNIISYFIFACVAVSLVCFFVQHSLALVYKAAYDDIF